MGVYKEIAKADGSGITTFYRLSEENSTVETTSTGTTETMFDYNDVLNKPSINDVALVGNKTLEDLGIQPAGDYITEIPEEYITEDELEAKDYATEAFVIEQINNTEHFHREIVDALPLTGKDNILYLVPKKGSDKDIYNEYIWTGVDYEFMGTTAVDLTDYYQKNEVDELLDNKVNKVNGKQLSTNDYTTAEKTKLASLENYDDSELRGKVEALHNYDDTEVRLDINSLKAKTSNNEIDITSIENELGYKAEVIRLVKSGDWWLCQDAKGNNLTLEMAMNRLSLPKTILLLENLENDGKYYPVEYELQEKYIDIIYKDLDGITHHLNYGYNEYFTNTASGDYIHLEDSINYPYKELSIDGVCKQEVRSGKNLLKNILTSQTINGVTITKYDDGSFLLNGTSTIEFYPSLTDNFTIEAGTYTLSSGEAEMSNEKIKIVLRQTQQNVIITQLFSGTSMTFNNTYTGEVFAFLGIRKDQTFNNVLIKPMLEKGQSQTDWEPYGVSPSPDYPQEIKTIENSLKITSCNKNLLKLIDGDFGSNGINANVKNGIITLNGTPTSGISFLKLCDFNFTFKANTIYSVSINPSYFIEGNETRFRFSKKNGDIVIKDVYFSNSSNKLTFSFTEDTNVEWLQIRTGPNINYNNLVIKPQLEEETTTTPFEQHLEIQITANIPEGEFIGKINDTYKDTLKVEYNEEDGQYHLNLYKNIGKVILNGSEDWISRTSTVTNYLKYRLTNGLPLGAKAPLAIISNYFITNKGANDSPYEGNAICSNSGNYNKWLHISIDSTLASNTDEFKTWLSNNNVTVYHALAIPYVVDLGVVDMPVTYDGATNLFTDSDLLPSINIEYYTEILENAKDNIIGQDIYLQDEVDTLNDLPTESNKGDIRKVKDTESWYIYDGVKWSAFDKASEVDLSNYLSKDNTIAYKPATDYNPSTKKYVDDSIADIFIPTKTSQLTNDSGFVLKTANDLTNYYNKSNTYNKAEVNALVAGGGGSSVDITLNGVSTTSPSFYAPINGGTSGQVLTSNGSSAPTWGALSTVATSGSYNDLSDKPAIPTKTSQLTNDSNYTTLWSVENSFDDGTVICGWSSTATDGQDMTSDYGMTPAMAASIQAGKKYTWDSRVSFSGTNNAVCYYASNDFGTADDGTRYNYVSAKIGSNTDWISFCWDDTTVYYGSTWPGSSGGKACFAGDTLVWTPDGEKKIKDIQIGDKVMSINIEKDIIEPREITKLVNHEEEEILVIATEDDIIEATGSHPFYEKSKGKANARILEVGDELMDDKFGLHKITKIEKKEFNDTVYEIVVDYTHNYFIGKNHIRVFNEPSVLKD